MSDLKDEGSDQIAMEIADETIKRAGRKAAVGRVDGGQEQELRGELLKAKAKKLMRLHDDIKAANAAYSSEVKEAAKETGFNASVIRRLVGARNSSNYGLFVSRQEQLQIAILEAGE